MIHRLIYCQLIFIIFLSAFVYSDEDEILIKPLDFNFIFYEGNNFYCSIPNDGIDVFQNIIDELDINKLSDEYNYGPAIIPKEIENKSLELMGEDYSKTISAIIPEYSDRNIDFSKRELVLQPSGDGGYWGFLRKLEIAPFVNMKDIDKIFDGHLLTLRPIGICWTKTEDQPITVSNINFKILSIHDSIDDFKLLLNVIDKIEQIYEYSLDSNRKIIIGEFAKEDGSRHLISYIYYNNNFNQLSFELTDTIIERFLEIETNEFANDVSQHDTRYWLIKIEETNTPILFIKSTVSIIFELFIDDNKSVWKTYSYYYRGP